MPTETSSKLLNYTGLRTVAELTALGLKITDLSVTPKGFVHRYVGTPKGKRKAVEGVYHYGPSVGAYQETFIAPPAKAKK